MHLQAALGVALMFTRGNSDATRSALARSLAIAEACGDAPDRLQLLNLLHMFHHRSGDFKNTLDYARRSMTVAEAVATPAAVALARCLLGSSLHHAGDLGGARAALEAALHGGPGDPRTSAIKLDFAHYNYAGAALARTLWLQGHPAQAVECARRSVADAVCMGHPVPLSRALVWAVSVFLWAGDLDSADAHADRLIAHAESHSLGPHLVVARGYKGELAIRRGDAKGGVASLQRGLEVLHAARYELLTAAFHVALVQGLAALERFAEASALIDETIGRVEANGELSYLAEALRVKAGVLLSMAEPSRDDAEACLMRSLDVSRRQGARAWELRTAIDLARLWAGQGKADNARSLLQPVFDQFTEGLDTADLQSAHRLLATLG
jgi:tetratricopeptide (TPR) repeat protein